MEKIIYIPDNVINKYEKRQKEKNRKLKRRHSFLDCQNFCQGLMFPDESS